MKEKIYIPIIVICFILFGTMVLIRNIKAKEEWIQKEISGVINDIAVKENDKFTFFKIDQDWYGITSRNSDFEEISYIGYYFEKRKGEEVFWLKESVNSNDSISYWTHGASLITSKTEIYTIEKSRLTWE